MRFCLFLIALASSALSQTSAAEDETKVEAAKASKMAGEELKLWSLRPNDPRRPPLTLRADPVLRYSNPAVGRVYGDVYLFTAGGRPEALFVIYKWFTPYHGFEAELHSLSAVGLVAERDDKVAWQPDRPGVEWRDVPHAPAPAETPGERLVQMRSLARDFTARLVDVRVNKGGEEQALRLLTKPLYRDDPAGPASRDVALFAFVLGTDPEVFLLLDAAQTPRGPRWRFALARMNRDGLRVFYKGQEVWKASPVDPHTDTRAAYWSQELPQDGAGP